MAYPYTALATVYCLHTQMATYKAENARFLGNIPGRIHP